MEDHGFTWYHDQRPYSIIIGSAICVSVGSKCYSILYRKSFYTFTVILKYFEHFEFIRYNITLSVGQYRKYRTILYIFNNDIETETQMSDYVKYYIIWNRVTAFVLIRCTRHIYKMYLRSLMESLTLIKRAIISDQIDKLSSLQFNCHLKLIQLRDKHGKRMIDGKSFICRRKTISF